MTEESMIERVARAIYETTAGAWTGVPWAEAEQDQHLRQARAAIEAMRNPTDEMFAAGEKAAMAYCERWSMSIANDVWAAMLPALDARGMPGGCQEAPFLVLMWCGNERPRPLHLGPGSDQAARDRGGQKSRRRIPTTRIGRNRSHNARRPPDPKAEGRCALRPKAARVGVGRPPTRGRSFSTG